MNAYTLEINWAGGVSFVYAEGENLAAVERDTLATLLAREKTLSASVVDAFAHAECDPMQPCKNGIL